MSANPVLVRQPGPPSRLGVMVAEQDIHWEQLARLAEIAGTLQAFRRISETTGGYVRILSSFALCPALIGSDENLIPLYEFVEVIDGLVDYDAIREEFPTLSYAQIGGAILFLRKIVQLNIRGIDIDVFENEILARDENLMADLRSALADREVGRVLTSDEQNP